MKVNIDVHDVTTYQGSKTPTEALLFCDQKFDASTGETVPEGSDDNRLFYKKVPVTVDDNGKIRLGAFTDDNAVDSTTDGKDNQTSTYTLSLYAGKTFLCTLYENLRINPAPSSQNWGDINLNSRLPFYTQAPTEFLTLTRFYQLLDGFSPAAKATSLITGITRLSTTPEDLSDPIAVGDNDPRLNLLNRTGIFDLEFTEQRALSPSSTLADAINALATLIHDLRTLILPAPPLSGLFVFDGDELVFDGDTLNF